MRSKYAKQPVRGKEDFSLKIKVTAMGVREANLFALLR
jgi:hypothetical protein